MDRHGHHSWSEDGNQLAVLCLSQTYFCVGGPVKEALINLCGSAAEDRSSAPPVCVFPYDLAL